MSDQSPPDAPRVYKRRKGLIRSSTGRGRPGEYHDGIPEAVFRLTLLGATNEEIAGVIGITVEAYYEWQRQHPEILQAATRGKLDADARVTQSLFNRAIGYSHPAVKIFKTSEDQILRAEYVEHYPPDTQAAKHWLNNRRPQNWRERVEHEFDGSIPVRFIIEKTERSEEDA